MTSIEWTDATWNPVTGCTKVSAGCKSCYAEKVAERFWGDRAFTDVRWHADRLDAPLRWRKPRRVFVNSMSDLFHDAVPDEFIDLVFAVMVLAPQHTFQVLTKRPERMRDYFGSMVERSVAIEEVDVVANARRRCAGEDDPRGSRSWHSETARFAKGLAAVHAMGRRGIPLPNVWLGVSCEDQRAADERIPLLLQTPAAVRFLSCEPLLGPIGIPNGWLGEFDGQGGIDWVIAGGESGPGARPCDVAWIRSIVEQCNAERVACFVKQLGAKPVARDRWDMSEQVFTDLDASEDGWSEADGAVVMPLRDRKGGDPSEWAEDLRVREFPR